jgi:glc operon protein GlcG
LTACAATDARRSDIHLAIHLGALLYNPAPILAHDVDSIPAAQTRRIPGGKTMSSRFVLRLLAVLMILFCGTTAKAQQMPNAYGAPISLDNAKKAAAAALAETRKNNWTMAVAVVDTHGTLVYFEKLDETQVASAQLAINKAHSSALYKRPTKALQDALAKGGEGLRVLGLEGAVPVEGGYPILIDGKIVGAIGMSGGTSAQDDQCAKIGADAVK